MAFALHRAHQLGQARLDLVMSIASDQSHAASDATGVERVEHAQQRVRLKAGSTFHANRVADTAQEFDMRRTFEAGAIANPQHVRRGVIPLAGERILTGQRLLIRQQQRLMAGVETGSLDLRDSLWRDAAGFHEGQRLTDAVGHIFELLCPGRTAHEIVGPCMHLMQVCVTALAECAKQVQRCGCLAVRLDHAFGIGLTRCRLKGDIVDDVTAIARQFDITDYFGIGRSRLCELAGHAANLHDRQFAGKSQHDRHLQDHAESIADIVRVEFGKAFGTIAALQQEGPALCHIGKLGRQVARLTGKNQRREIAQRCLGCFQCCLVAIGRHLLPIMVAPAFGRPFRRHYTLLHLAKCGRPSRPVRADGASKSAFARFKRKFVAALHNNLQSPILQSALIQRFPGVPRWNSANLALLIVHL